MTYGGYGLWGSLSRVQWFGTGTVIPGVTNVMYRVRGREIKSLITGAHLLALLSTCKACAPVLYHAEKPGVG